MYETQDFLSICLPVVHPCRVTLISFTLLSLISGGLCLAAGTIVYAMVRGVG